MSTGRRLLVHPHHLAYIAGYNRAMLDARADASVSNFETLCELHDLKREVADLRDILGLMVSTLRIHMTSHLGGDAAASPVVHQRPIATSETLIRQKLQSKFMRQINGFELVQNVSASFLSHCCLSHCSTKRRSFDYP